MKRVGIVIFPQVEELDFVGPLEVLGLVNRCLKESSEKTAF